jgi:hypothetical protein
MIGPLTRNRVVAGATAGTYPEVVCGEANQAGGGARSGACSSSTVPLTQTMTATQLSRLPCSVASAKDRAQLRSSDTHRCEEPGMMATCSSQMTRSLTGHVPSRVRSCSAANPVTPIAKLHSQRRRRPASALVHMHASLMEAQPVPGTAPPDGLVATSKGYSGDVSNSVQAGSMSGSRISLAHVGLLAAPGARPLPGSQAQAHDRRPMQQQQPQQLQCVHSLNGGMQQHHIQHVATGCIEAGMRNTSSAAVSQSQELGESSRHCGSSSTSAGLPTTTGSAATCSAAFKTTTRHKAWHVAVKLQTQIAQTYVLIGVGAHMDTTALPVPAPSHSLRRPRPQDDWA